MTNEEASAAERYDKAAKEIRCERMEHLDTPTKTEKGSEEGDVEQRQLK